MQSDDVESLYNNYNQYCCIKSQRKFDTSEVYTMEVENRSKYKKIRVLGK